MAQNVNSLSPEKAKVKFNFVSGIKEELKKVTWTEKKELQHSTKIVLGATLFFGLSTYIVDLMIKGMLDSLGRLING